MRPDLRRDEPRYRQAARGVGWVVLLSLGVFAVGAAIVGLFVFAMA